MKSLYRLNGWLVHLLVWLAVASIAAMTIGISIEVVLRMFGFPSIIGLIELTEYGLFISTFFAAPYLLRTNEHIRVDIVMSRIDPVQAKIVEFGVLACIISVSVITGTIATMMMIGNIKAGTLIFKDLIFPQYYLDWIIPVAALAMTFQALEMMTILARSPAERQSPAEHVPGIQPGELS
jgi:TRAP-type C4-dicarboxylate transport system permease small subunit